MSVVLDDGIIRLSGNCGLEDVETLLGFLQSQAQPKVDLRQAHHLHGAVLQLLIAVRPRLEHLAEDPFVRQLTVGLAEEPTT